MKDVTAVAPGPTYRRSSERLDPPRLGLCGLGLLVVVTSGVPAPLVLKEAAGLTGMAVLVWAWLRLGRQAVDTPPRRAYRILALWCLPLVVARPLFSGDVASYVAQGVTAARGLDPYVLGPVRALGASSPVTQQVSHYWQNTPAPYGPVFLALSQTIARITAGDLTASLMLYRAVGLVGIGLIAWALPRLAIRTGASPATALWLGLLNPLVLWHLVTGAHNDGLMLGLVLTGMEAALDGLARGAAPGWIRTAAGACLIIVAANIKVVALAAMCCIGAELVRRSRTPTRRYAIVAGLVTGSVCGCLLISAVTRLGLGWISAMGASQALHSWLAPTNVIGFVIGAVASRAGHDLTSSAITFMVRLGAVAGAAIAVHLLRAVIRGRLHPLRALGWLFAAMLLFGPVVQPWYLLWAIVPFAATVRNVRESHTLTAASAVAAMLLPPVTGDARTIALGYLSAGALVAALGIVRLSAAQRAAGPGGVWRHVLSPRHRRRGSQLYPPTPPTGPVPRGSPPPAVVTVPIPRTCWSRLADRLSRTAPAVPARRRPPAATTTGAIGVANRDRLLTRAGRPPRPKPTGPGRLRPTRAPSTKS